MSPIITVSVSNRLLHPDLTAFGAEGGLRLRENGLAALQKRVCKSGLSLLATHREKTAAAVNFRRRLRVGITTVNYGHYVFLWKHIYGLVIWYNRVLRL